jgi:hypothetical protein
VADYEAIGNRWTMVLIKRTLPSGEVVTRRADFDLVRFNVDVNPNAKRVLVPRGDDYDKVFEKIWITDIAPWRKKVSFNGVS